MRPSSLLFLLVYVGAVTWLTWPLGEHITDGIWGEGPFRIVDILYSMWVMAWTSHSLVTAPWQLANANIYHPTSHAFFYGPSAFGGVPLFAPVFWTTNNPVLATNVVFLGGLALTAWTTHLVVRRWTGSELAGMVAAATILANDWLVRGFVAATPHMAVLQYLPLIAFAAATPAARLRDAVPLFLLIVVQSLTDSMYVAPAVFAVVGTVALIRFARRDTRAAAKTLVMVLGLAAIVLAPIYVGYVSVRRANPDLAHQSAYKTHAPVQYFPDQFFNPMRAGPGVFVPATVVLVAAGLVAMVARRRFAGTMPGFGGWGPGALWTVVGMVISLSPVVVWGRWRVPVPQRLFEPLYAHLRDPVRLGTVTLVGSAILAGMAFAEIARWIDRIGRRRVIAAIGRTGFAASAIVPLFVGSGGTLPPVFPVLPMKPPEEAMLQAIREIPGPLVETPAPQDWNNTLAMYSSLFHWHPLLNGYSSYYPSEFKQRMAFARRLPNPDALAILRAETGVAAVLVHLGGLELPERAPWLGIPKSGRRDLVFVTRHGTDMLFRVESPEAPR